MDNDNKRDEVDNTDKRLHISDVMCSCGKYEKCIRKVKVKDGGYFGSTKLYVDKKDHFRCGRVQKQIKQI